MTVFVEGGGVGTVNCSRRQEGRRRRGARCQSVKVWCAVEWQAVRATGAYRRIFGAGVRLRGIVPLFFFLF
jgi:hypothetical protein